MCMCVIRARKSICMYTHYTRSYLFIRSFIHSLLDQVIRTCRVQAFFGRNVLNACQTGGDRGWGDKKHIKNLTDFHIPFLFLL